MKIVFDENVPIQMVRVFRAFASEKRLRKLAGDFEIVATEDYTPKPGDADYIKKNDVPWLKRFAEDGGKIVISGNTRMKSVPHERLALVDLGFTVVFFEGQWSQWPFFTKCALLLHWWPAIAKKVKRPKPGFWHIPCNWKQDGKLRKVSSEDPLKLRMERKHTKKPTKPKAEKPAPEKTSDGPLFDFAARKKRKRKRRNDDGQEAQV